MSDRTQSTMGRANQARDEIAVIRNQVLGQEDKYRGILPSSVSFADFSNAFLTAVQMNPRLLDADRQSLFLALQRAASDGLKPDGREGALVIYGDDQEDGTPSAANAKKKVQWLPMVWGLLKTVRNAEEVKSVTVECVYKGEFVQIILGDEPKFEHRRSTEPDFDDSFGNIIGAYAIVVYKNGAIEREWMSRAKIERVRATSRARKGPWGPWYDEQSRKTVLKRLMKRLDRSADLRRITSALEHDETLGTEIEGEGAVEIPRTTAAQDQILREEFQRPRPQEEQRRPVPREVPRTEQRPPKRQAMPGSVPVPQSDGQDDWLAYAIDCRNDLENRHTAAEIDEWERTNLPTYSGRAIMPRIVQHLNARRAVVGQAFDALFRDQFGDTIHDDPYTDPVEFANDLIALYNSPSLDREQSAALLEFNADAIVAARAWPEAAEILAILDDPAADDEPQQVIAVTWTRWLAAIREVAPKQTADRLPGWVSAQQERFARAPNSQRELAARSVRAALHKAGLSAPAWLAPPIPNGKPAAPAEATAGDADQQWVARIIAELNEIRQIDETGDARARFYDLQRSSAVQAEMTRLSRDRRPLFDEAKAVFEATLASIEARTSQAPETDPDDPGRGAA